MFQIKVCGITNVDDALAAAGAGADAIGLNFYARSPRFVTSKVAGEIIAALPTEIVKVGVFVDTPAADIRDLFDTLRLDLVQLHGDQPPELVGHLAGRPVMKAFRVGPDGLLHVAEYLEHCRMLSARLMMVMLDAFVPGQYGGTGRVIDWSIAQRYASEIGSPPLVLAGGLTPENVGDAIRAVRPAAVDVASGVESRPGRKDHAAVAAFVAAARAAFNSYTASGLK